MNHYEILRIHSSASTEDIRKHYYRYAKLYHPDKHSGDPEKCEYFKKLSEAYATLSNPKKRYIYDMKLRTESIPEFQKIFEIQFSDDDLLVIQKYYEKISSSTEFKFLKILYKSLPETSKTNLKTNLKNGLNHLKTTLFHKDKDKHPDENISEDSLADISDLRYIDGHALLEFTQITLKRSFEDVYRNICKRILVKLRDSSHYLYITHSDYTIHLPNLEIHIATDVPEHIHVNGCDIYAEQKINLYQYYYVRNHILKFPEGPLLYDRDTRMILGKGLRNPRTHLRHNLHISQKLVLNLSPETILANESIIKRIFDFDMSKIK